MRALFYSGDRRWDGSARAMLSAARGLVGRGHPVLIACCGGSRLETAARADGFEVISMDPAASAAGAAWDMRRLMRDKFVEVVFVHEERAQLVVSSAMRIAKRGAVYRRVPSFMPVRVRRSGRVALRMAAAGLLFTTEKEMREAGAGAREFTLPATVAPLGVDAASYDDVVASTRQALGVPATGLLIVCSYDDSARLRAANVFRTVATLALRHREIHLVVVGPGSTDPDLRMHAAALGIGRLVTFLGEREDEIAVLRAADVGWVAADNDNGAFACLDFMALRIPVLAERTPLAQHYVADGIAGVLLGPGEPAITAAAVASFLAQRDRRTAMGNAGRARVQREFPEAAMIDGFESAGQYATDRAQWGAR